MKRIFGLVLIIAVVAAAAGCEQSVVYDDVAEIVQESAIIEEIPLANGAVLIVEPAHGFSSKVSIWFNDSVEPKFLFYDWDSLNYEISPDLKKIAYIINNDKTSSGTLCMFDVVEREDTRLEFEDYIKPEDSVYWNESKGMIWLDNEILLTLAAVWHASWSMGGSVHYYNTTDGSNKMIIPHDFTHFQVTKLEIVDDELKLTILINDGSAYNYRKFINQSIPLAKIYELIENGETLILDVPDFDEIED